MPLPPHSLWVGLPNLRNLSLHFYLLHHRKLFAYYQGQIPVLFHKHTGQGRLWWNKHLELQTRYRGLKSDLFQTACYRVRLLKRSISSHPYAFPSCVKCVTLIFERHVHHPKSLNLLKWRMLHCGLKQQQ